MEMPQINVSVSDKVHEMLIKLANDTGITKSSLASEYIRRGVYQDIKDQALVNKYLQNGTSRD